MARKKRLKKKHIDLASSTAFRLPDLPAGVSVEDAWEQTRALAKKWKVKDVKRARGRFAITYADRVFLPKSFFDVELWNKVTWYRHELVHVLQQRKVGILRFSLQWSSPLYRCAYETSANAQSIRDLRVLFPGRKKAIREYADARVRSIFEDYGLRRIDRARTEPIVRNIVLTGEAP